MPRKDLEKKRAYEREFNAQPEVRERRSATNKEWKLKNRDAVLAREAKRRLEKRAMVLVATVRTRPETGALSLTLTSTFLKSKPGLTLVVAR